MFLDLPPYEVHQFCYLGVCVVGEGEFDGPDWFVECDIKGKKVIEVWFGELIYCEIVLGCADALAGLGVRCFVGLARRDYGFYEADWGFFDGDPFHWAFKHRKNTDWKNIGYRYLTY